MKFHIATSNLLCRHRSSRAYVIQDCFSSIASEWAVDMAAMIDSAMKHRGELRILLQLERRS